MSLSYLLDTNVVLALVRGNMLSLAPNHREGPWTEHLDP